MNRSWKRMWVMTSIALLALASLANAQGHRREDLGGPNGALGNPGIYPVNSSPFGKTYGQWSAEHWKYIMSIPYASSPLNDQSGANCDVGQSGPVWYLAGTFCPNPEPCAIATATRDCTVPYGKAIFFPIIDVECSTYEGNGTTDAELRACASGFQDLAAGMSAEIDGVSVENVNSYRVQSPLFTMGPFPADNILGAPAGTTTPSVSDGVFLMVKPLSLGDHTIHFAGGIPAFGFGLDVTYHLHIVTTQGAAQPMQATHSTPATWGRLRTIYR